MMEDSRKQKLHELLRRLGKALHTTVVRSDEVRACLDELHDDGWRAVMLLETSLACTEDGTLQVERGHLRLHVDTETDAVDYLIDADDARLLESLGISVSRHRSRNTGVRRPQADRDPRSGS
jgi:hypothetical protein